MFSNGLPVSLPALLILLQIVCLPSVYSADGADFADVQVRAKRAQLESDRTDWHNYRQLVTALIIRAEKTGDPADYDAALEVLDEADKKELTVPRLVAERARLLLSRHRFAEALKIAEEALEKFPKYDIQLGIAGDAAIEMGKLEKAETYYERLIKIDPTEQANWSRLSRLAELRGDLKKATELTEKAINAKHPKPLTPRGLSWGYSVLGDLWLNRGRPDLARLSYKYGLSKSPTDDRLHMNVAALEQREGNLARAEEHYRKALELNPGPRVQLQLANLLAYKGEMEEARQLAKQARETLERIVIKGGNERYLRALSELDRQQGRYQRSAELMARDVALRPTDEGCSLFSLILAEARAKDSAVDEGKRGIEPAQELCAEKPEVIPVKPPVKLDATR